MAPLPFRFAVPIVLVISPAAYTVASRGPDLRLPSTPMIWETLYQESFEADVDAARVRDGLLRPRDPEKYPPPPATWAEITDRLLTLDELLAGR